MDKGIHAGTSVCTSSISEADAPLELWLTREQIGQRVGEMGAAISRDFAGDNLLLVGVLKGAAIFLADLLRSISVGCSFDFVSAESYGEGVKSSGAVRLRKDLDRSIEGCNVVLVEDILDSGATVEFVRNLLAKKNPASLKIAALLDKPSRRRVDISADYVGFTIPNRFVVGYGMDFAERYRQLPDIHFLPETIQTSSTPTPGYPTAL